MQSGAPAESHWRVLRREGTGGIKTEVPGRRGRARRRVRVWGRGRVCLEDEAHVLLARLGAREQGGARSVLEHLADTLTRLRGTFEIVLGADLLGHGHTLDGGQRLEQRHKRRER